MHCAVAYSVLRQVASSIRSSCILTWANSAYNMSHWTANRGWISNVLMWCQRSDSIYLILQALRIAASVSLGFGASRRVEDVGWQQAGNNFITFTVSMLYLLLPESGSKTITGVWPPPRTIHHAPRLIISNQHHPRPVSLPHTQALMNSIQFQVQDQVGNFWSIYLRFRLYYRQTHKKTLIGIVRNKKICCWIIMIFMTVCYSACHDFVAERFGFDWSRPTIFDDMFTRRQFIGFQSQQVLLAELRQINSQAGRIPDIPTALATA